MKQPTARVVEASTGFDLVVMGTHGRGAIAHLFLGSVTERVIRKAHCPVLTLHHVDAKEPKHAKETK